MSDVQDHEDTLALVALRSKGLIDDHPITALFTAALVGLVLARIVFRTNTGFGAARGGTTH